MTEHQNGLQNKEDLTHSTNKSSSEMDDIDALTENYRLLRSKLKKLIDAVKRHHDAMLQISYDRVEVAEKIACLAKNSPLDKCAADESVSSYLFLHKDMAERSEKYADEYEEFSIYYAIAWDNTVESRVSAARKELETLRRELDHYEKKVETLRKHRSSYLSRGKDADDQFYEKLGRNERKLVKSKKKYMNYVKSLSNILKEVTEHSWRDLRPLLIKLARFDLKTSAEEAQRMSSLKQVLKQLKSIAIEHGGLKADDRMKELSEMQPTAALDSRNSSQNEKEFLSIRDGHLDIHYFPEDDRDDADHNIETFLTKRHPQVRPPQESVRVGSIVDDSSTSKESGSILHKLKLDEVDAMDKSESVAEWENLGKGREVDREDHSEKMGSVYAGQRGGWAKSLKQKAKLAMCHNAKKPLDTDEENEGDEPVPYDESEYSYSVVGSERCAL